HLDACGNCRRLAAHVAEGLDGGPRADATSEPPAELAAIGPGARVGRYLVLEVVGKGAMGTVFAAFDPELDRKVALKLLRPSLGSSNAADELHTRLLREAQAMARLSHPNVTAVHDVGTYGAGIFVAMDFVEGTTLRGWIEERPHSWREILGVFL